MDSWVSHETTEEGWWTYRPKRCEYNNKDEDNGPIILSNNNSYNVSSSG